MLQLKGKSKIKLRGRGGENREPQNGEMIFGSSLLSLHLCVSGGDYKSSVLLPDELLPEAHLSCPSAYLDSLGTLSNLLSAVITFVES